MELDLKQTDDRGLLIYAISKIESMEEKLDGIDRKLNDNGQLGLISRVGIVEGAIKNLFGKIGNVYWIIGILTLIGCAVVGAGAATLASIHR